MTAACSLPGTATIATYGGVKVDSAPIEDPTTNLSADEWTACAADVAMMTRTALRAWIKFTGATYTSGTQSITIVGRSAMWGASEDVAVTQTSAGSYSITYPTTIVDETGVSKTLGLIDVIAAKAFVYPVTWTGHASANVAQVKLYRAGALDSCDGDTITVVVI